jgi:hypothetical protein
MQHAAQCGEGTAELAATAVAAEEKAIFSDRGFVLPAAIAQ